MQVTLLDYPVIDRKTKRQTRAEVAKIDVPALPFVLIYQGSLYQLAMEKERVYWRTKLEFIVIP